MNRTGERGVAVLLALMSLVLLSTLGAGLVLGTSTESAIGGNFRVSVEARFAARAVAERALLDLAGLSSWDPAFSGAVRSSFADGPPGGPRLLTGGFSVDLTELVNLANCGQVSFCTVAGMNVITARRPWGANNPRWQLYAWGPPDLLAGLGSTGSSLYLVVLIGDDAAENDGDPEVDGLDASNPGTGRAVLRALALGARGVRSGLELTIVRGWGGGVNLLSIKGL